MLRSFGAVLAGFTLAAVVVMAGTVLATTAFAGPEGEPTPLYLAANLILSAAAALLGGVVAARLAVRAPLVHGVALALLLVGLSLPNVARPASGQPAWYPAVLLVLAGLGASLGGVLVARRAAVSPDGAGAT